MVEGQAEACGEVLLDIVHFGAIGLDRFACLGGGEFGGGAVFVGGADEHDLVAARAHVAGEEVGGQLAADEVAEVLDPVDVGDGGGDENPCHVRAFRPVRRGV